MTTRMITALLVVLALIGVSAGVAAQSDRERAAIESRIKPEGDVCLQGDASCAVGASAAGAVARSGEDVYNAACMACHLTGAANAPKLGDVAAWADRISKGIDALYDAGVNGIPGTGMIAKGGCMDCSDEEVIAAVDYMVENSQ